jgi:hypothetical protein
MTSKAKKWGQAQPYNQTAKIPVQYMMGGMQKPASPSNFAQTGSVVRQSAQGQMAN